MERRNSVFEILENENYLGRIAAAIPPIWGSPLLMVGTHRNKNLKNYKDIVDLPGR